MVESRRIYYGWVLVWALGVTTIVSYGTTQYLFGVLVVPVERDLGWSRAGLSGAFSLAIVVSGLLGVPIGRLVDRHGARWLMTAGSVLGAASLALLALVRQEWQFYVLWSGGLGLAMALTFYPVTFVVATNWFIRRRGSAMALLTLIGGLASVIFIPLAGVLIARLGWRPALIILGACQLAVCAPIHALLIRRRPEDHGLLPDGEPRARSSPAPEIGGHAFRAALGDPGFWMLTAASGLSLLGNAVILAHQVPILIGYRYPPVFAAAAAGLLGVASLPARLVLNLLSDRFGARAMLVVATLLQAAGVALLAGAAVPALLWAYVAVYGFAFGAVSPLRASVMADHFGRRAYGAITATQGVPVSLLAAAGPLAAGALFDRLGDYTLTLAGTGGAFAAAAVILLLVPRPPAAASSWPVRAPAAP